MGNAKKGRAVCVDRERDVADLCWSKKDGLVRREQDVSYVFLQRPQKEDPRSAWPRPSTEGR
jgi:hypothetical protein